MKKYAKEFVLKKKEIGINIITKATKVHYVKIIWKQNTFFKAKDKMLS